MIVFERERDFVMTEQHLHAELSGVFASHWQDDAFRGFNRKGDVVLAIAGHDRAWIDLDAYPLWNDASHAPFSFMDMPYTIKLLHYRYGIDRLEKENDFAALLCSMHYASFFGESVNPNEREYREFELDRQKRILAQLPPSLLEGEVAFHLAVLKFLDRLSLYVCLNEPGVTKDEEFSWYRNGFEDSEHLGFSHGERVIARWLDEERIGLSAFPFESAFEASVPIKVVSKKRIAELGIAEAYQTTQYGERKIQLVPQR